MNEFVSAVLAEVSLYVSMNVMSDADLDDVCRATVLAPFGFQRFDNWLSFREHILPQAQREIDSIDVLTHYLSAFMVETFAIPLLSVSNHKIRAVPILRVDPVGVGVYSLDLVSFTEYFQTPQLP